MHENMLYKIIQDGDKSFEALVVSKSLALTTLVNFHNHQGHTGTNKTYSQIKEMSFGRGMYKDIDRFIQNSHICKQHNLQQQLCSYMHMKLPHRQFDTIACNSIGPFTPSSFKGKSYILTCMCLLTNFPFAIPIPIKLAETIIKAYLQHIHAIFSNSLTLIINI